MSQQSKTLHVSSSEMNDTMASDKMLLICLACSTSHYCSPATPLSLKAAKGVNELVPATGTDAKICEGFRFRMIQLRSNTDTKHRLSRIMAISIACCRSPFVRFLRGLWAAWSYMSSASYVRMPRTLEFPPTFDDFLMCTLIREYRPVLISSWGIHQRAKSNAGSWRRKRNLSIKLATAAVWDRDQNTAG